MDDWLRYHAVALPEVLSAVQASTLAAVVRVHPRDGRCTLRTVMAEAGVSSTATIWFRLRSLKALGLITWAPGEQGTLRPLVKVVKVS